MEEVSKEECERRIVMDFKCEDIALLASSLLFIRMMMSTSDTFYAMERAMYGMAARRDKLTPEELDNLKTMASILAAIKSDLENTTQVLQFVDDQLKRVHSGEDNL